MAGLEELDDSVRTIVARVLAIVLGVGMLYKLDDDSGCCMGFCLHGARVLVAPADRSKQGVNSTKREHANSYSAYFLGSRKFLYLCRWPVASREVPRGHSILLPEILVMKS